MKVALLIPSLKKKGPIVFTEYLVNSLLPFVDSVVVFYFNAHKPSDDLVNFNCATRKISFFEKIDLSSYDIIHSTMLLPDLYMAWHRVARIKPCCTSMHNHIYEDLSMLHPKWRAFLMSFLWYSSYEFIPNFVVSSDSMLKYYQKRLPENKSITKIPYGVAVPTCIGIVDENLALNKLKKKFKIIGSCGVLIKRKGYETLIKYIATSPGTALILIGDGPDKKRLECLASFLNVSDRVLILGFKDNYADYYSYFDIFAMTSYSEGYGIAMLEAMSMGLPLVCSDLDIYRDIFPKHELCQFKPGNLESLGLAMHTCLQSLDDFSLKSREVYNLYFSLNSMGALHFDYYKSLIQR